MFIFGRWWLFQFCPSCPFFTSSSNFDVVSRSLYSSSRRHKSSIKLSIGFVTMAYWGNGINGALRKHLMGTKDTSIPPYCCEGFSSWLWQLVSLVPSICHMFGSHAFLRLLSSHLLYACLVVQIVEVHNEYKVPVHQNNPIVHGNLVCPVVLAYLFDPYMSEGLIVMPDIYLPMAGKYDVSVELRSRLQPTICCMSPPHGPYFNWQNNLVATVNLPSLVVRRRVDIFPRQIYGVCPLSFHVALCWPFYFFLLLFSPQVVPSLLTYHLWDIGLIRNIAPESDEIVHDFAQRWVSEDTFRNLVTDGNGELCIFSFYWYLSLLYMYCDPLQSILILLISDRIKHLIH